MTLLPALLLISRRCCSSGTDLETSRELVKNGLSVDSPSLARRLLAVSSKGLRHKDVRANSTGNRPGRLFLYLAISVMRAESLDRHPPGRVVTLSPSLSGLDPYCGIAPPSSIGSDRNSLLPAPPI
ncbi:hypothetical protein BDN70DRAFT_879954 [Pholiota conissans]|uniref:Secreted protein n=1 Tax=Pholiota conissans TaxID=109636 RepID=A0A9P6D094_9AGAR|nr:hypothetical protein BDN70DRAFT_879954 [Pholiota conissans]